MSKKPKMDHFSQKIPEWVILIKDYLFGIKNKEIGQLGQKNQDMVHLG